MSARPGLPQGSHSAARKAEDLLEFAPRGRCAGLKQELFFPEKGNRSNQEAKRVCRACLVRWECLAYALKHDERYGIWGGFAEKERRAIKREQRAAAKASVNA